MADLPRYNIDRREMLHRFSAYLVSERASCNYHFITGIAYANNDYLSSGDKTMPSHDLTDVALEQQSRPPANKCTIRISDAGRSQAQI